VAATSQKGKVKSQTQGSFPRDKNYYLTMIYETIIMRQHSVLSEFN